MATLPKSDILRFNSVMLIDESSSELYATEQMLLIGADVRNVHKEVDAYEALNKLTSSTNPDDLPEVIFLDVKNTTPGSFHFLDQFENLSPMIRENCKVVLMSIYFQFKTELDFRLAKYEFVADKFTKPLDIGQLYRLQPQPAW